MAAQKRLEKGSVYEKYDVDGDGVVSDEELDVERRMIELEDLRSDTVSYTHLTLPTMIGV